MKEYSLYFPNEEATEKILLTPIGKNQYRLGESSISEEGIFYHDVIEARFRFGKGLSLMRVIERSGLRVFRFVLPMEVIGSELLTAFLQRVKVHNGYWELIFGGCLLVHLPRGSACRPKSELKALFHSLSEASA